MNIKPYLKSITIAACICLAVAIIIASILILEQNKRIQSLQGANSSLTSEMITYRNDNGKLLSEKHAAEIRARDIERLLPEVAESIKKDFNLKMRNLRAYVQAEFQVHGAGKADVSYIADGTVYVRHDGDTIVRIGGKWKNTSDKSDSITNHFEPFAVFAQDGYLDFHADVYDSLNAPYEYSYSDTIKYAFHMKGKFLQKKKLYGTGMLSNPNARILNSDAVLVNEFKDKRWGIGPYVGYGLGPDGMQWNIGISVHYSLIKL